MPRPYSTNCARGVIGRYVAFPRGYQRLIFFLVRMLSSVGKMRKVSSQLLNIPLIDVLHIRERAILIVLDVCKLPVKVVFESRIKNLCP